MSRPDFFDVHSHISLPEYDHDRGEVMDRMRYANVKTITIGVDLVTSKKAVEIAHEYGQYASIGLHPTDSRDESFNAEDYDELAEQKEVVAIGECGLDYYRTKPEDFETEKVRQEKEFRKQIEFALEYDLPLMIHARPTKGTMNAYEDVLEILKEAKKEHDNLRGNVHFFVGDTTIAKQFIDLTFTLSFTGILTFTSEYDDVIKQTDLSMLLSETDSPYATPIPDRGKRNEPVYVRSVVRRIAELKKIDEEVVRKQLVENAYRVFNFLD